MRTFAEADHCFDVPVHTRRNDPEVRRKMLDALAHWIEALLRDGL